MMGGRGDANLALYLEVVEGRGHSTVGRGRTGGAGDDNFLLCFGGGTRIYGIFEVGSMVGSGRRPASRCLVGGGRVD